MGHMRLDKFMSLCGRATRTETAKAVRSGEIRLNGAPVRRADAPVDPEKDEVVFRGEPVVYRAFTNILLHKPDGVVSATEDKLHGERTVLDLLPPEMLRLRPALFPCGRLDKHTTGLMLLTNNGPLAHRLLSPAHHVDKTYAFTVKFPLSADDVAALEAGVFISVAPSDDPHGTDGTAERAGYTTAPCRVILDPPDDDGGQRSGKIVLHEGKYHQIKRMMEVRHNQITSLCRLTFGPLMLDETSVPGAWRWLTDDETAALEACVDH